ncbi:uncharacterized protein LOC114285773 [Camellia sinensis]|uniref:uncharacterized protein LOC114285773 n=1 Tax=Camellia sinensis TaxID=4442 RepID=UPI0010359255|nr:uncharacterized protein LOC114285773 [Camellia sinensis]
MNAGKVSNGRVSCTRSCSNKKKKSSIPSLPDEIIFCILAWRPAEILYNSIRYVCRQWYNIINDPIFIKEQLLRCTTGLFIQQKRTPYRAQFVDFGKMNVALTEVNVPFPNTVLATCDGLVLFRDKQDTLHVANPLTKQSLIVPPFDCHPSYGLPYFSLVYARSTMECKVLCIDKPYGCDVYKCMMITPGKDHAWKLINTNTFSDPTCRIFHHPPVFVEGLLYWGSRCFRCVVAWDIESEMFYEFPKPAVQSKPCIFHFVPMAKSLSCLVWSILQALFDVFVLSDPMSGEWRKLYKIELDVQKYRLNGILNKPVSWPGQNYFVPFAWADNGEVFLCLSETPGHYVAHYVKTGETLIVGSYDEDGWPRFRSNFAYSLVLLPSSLSSLSTGI